LQKILSLFKKKLCLEIYLHIAVCCFPSWCKVYQVFINCDLQHMRSNRFQHRTGSAGQILGWWTKTGDYKIVKSDSECFGVECSLDCRCMSFSVCENSCQLNARSRTLVKNSLRHKPGCRYYDFRPFVVSSSSSKENLSWTFYHRRLPTFWQHDL
jgi:hypothetical protein